MRITSLYSPVLSFYIDHSVIYIIFASKFNDSTQIQSALEIIFTELLPIFSESSSSTSMYEVTHTTCWSSFLADKFSINLINMEIVIRCYLHTNFIFLFFISFLNLTKLSGNFFAEKIFHFLHNKIRADHLCIFLIYKAHAVLNITSNTSFGDLDIK